MLVFLICRAMASLRVILAWQMVLSGTASRARARSNEAASVEATTGAGYRRDDLLGSAFSAAAL